jgi:hypothetical protein
MTAWGVLSAVALGLAANEFSDLSPWLARRMVLGAARMWAETPEGAAGYAEEWTAVIEERPGKLFKLITALTFFCGAALRAAPRLRSAMSLGRPSLRVSLGTSDNANRVFVRLCTAALALINMAVSVVVIFEQQGPSAAGGLALVLVGIGGLYVLLLRRYGRRYQPAQVPRNPESACAVVDRSEGQDRTD